MAVLRTWQTLLDTLILYIFPNYKDVNMAAADRGHVGGCWAKSMADAHSVQS